MKLSKLAVKDFQTAEIHQGTCYGYLILRFVSAHGPQNAISHLGPRRSYKALRSKFVLPSASMLSNICRWEYTLIVDAFKKKLLSRNKVNVALDRWTSTNKLAIMTVIAYHKDQNRPLREVQLTFDELDSLIFSRFWKLFKDHMFRVNILEHGWPYIWKEF